MLNRAARQRTQEFLSLVDRKGHTIHSVGLGLSIGSGFEHTFRPQRMSQAHSRLVLPVERRSTPAAEALGQLVVHITLCTGTPTPQGMRCQMKV